MTLCVCLANIYLKIQLNLLLQCKVIFCTSRMILAPATVTVTAKIFCASIKYILIIKIFINLYLD